MENARYLMRTRGLSLAFRSSDGQNISMKGLKGKELDYAMVEYEQTKIEAFIDKYRSTRAESKVKALMNNINSTMPFSTSDVTEVLDKHFNPDDYRDQHKFNFRSYADRVKLGQKLIDMLYERKKSGGNEK